VLRSSPRRLRIRVHDCAGRGIDVEQNQGEASLTVRGSLVERNHDVGLFIAGSDVRLEASVVRDTLPVMLDGTGITVHVPCTGAPPLTTCNAAERASATITGSLIEQNHDIGLLVSESDASVEASVIRATSPRVLDGLFGDGMVVVGDVAAGSATVIQSRIEDSTRAGVASFGASVSLESTRIQCAAFELAGEAFGTQAFAFDDRLNNLCGCPIANATCKVVTAGLEPPLAEN